MTWEELKEEARKMGYKWGVYFDGKEYLIKPNKHDSAWRNILEQRGVYKLECADDLIIVGSNLSTDQMLAIMKALQ